jgi:hypothetical protein
LEVLIVEKLGIKVTNEVLGAADEDLGFEDEAH